MNVKRFAGGQRETAAEMGARRPEVGEEDEMTMAIRIVDGHGYCEEHSPRNYAAESVQERDGRPCAICAMPTPSARGTDRLTGPPKSGRRMR